MQWLKNLGVVIFFLVIAFIFLMIIDHFDFESVHVTIERNSKLESLIAQVHYALIVLLTFIIVCIGWIQSQGIKKNQQAEFLFRIDERLGDPAVIEARLIIHKLYSYSTNNNKNYTESEHRKFIEQQINLISQSEGHVKEYVYLLNFLDFLETVSLFANQGHISVNEIDDLMGQSLDFFYIIFQSRIFNRRQKYNDDSFYMQFERLVKKIRCKKTKCCCFCWRCFFNAH